MMHSTVFCMLLAVVNTPAVSAFVPSAAFCLTSSRSVRCVQELHLKSFSSRKVEQQLYYTGMLPKWNTAGSAAVAFVGRSTLLTSRLALPLLAIPSLL